MRAKHEMSHTLLPQCQRVLGASAGTLFYRVWVKREAGCIVQRQRDWGIEMRGRTLKIKQIKTTDLMSEIETVTCFRDLLSGWWMVCSSPSDRSIKQGGIQWITWARPQLYQSADLCSTCMCTCTCECVHIYNTHTHTKCLAQKVTHKPGQLKDRQNMHVKGINQYICLL